MTLLAQGAEAKVYTKTFMGRACVVKERFAKSYRLPELDQKLSHRRLVQEARCLLKSRMAGVPTPAIFLLDEKANILVMEAIDGIPLRAFLEEHVLQDKDGLRTYPQDAFTLASKLGELLARLHNADVVHGDLTTSNVLVSPDTLQLTMIDFGLANSQPVVEDKAVDLNVLERAFHSTHVHAEPLLHHLFEAYKAHAKDIGRIWKTLEKVQLRGRKRTMVG